jgi:L-arabinose isomerase
VERKKFMGILDRKVKPKIGFLFTGLEVYWSQYPEFVEIGSNMYEKYIKNLAKIGEVIPAKFVDNPERSEEAGRMFKENDIDILFILPFGYNTGMIIVPCIRQLDIPIRLLATHEDATYDYKTADTARYLHHSGICCIPEYASTLVSLERKFRVITGWLQDKRFWEEIEKDAIGAAAGKVFKGLNFAIIGNTYTNMTDMPADDYRLLKATGKLFLRPEIEEFEEEYHKVTDTQLQEMYVQFRKFYEVDKTVTNEHMKESAKIAVVFDKIIHQYDIHAYGYYWWGIKELVTQIRAQSNLAGSRLSSMGVPGVTEGDVKTAMAMKAMDLMGAGGMFLEFNTIDYKDEFLLISHDGPVNFNVSEGKPKLQYLHIHHGKTGHGLGIDFNLKKGPVTLLNWTQSDPKVETFKLIYTIGEVIEGDILHVGNPNGRLKVHKPIHQFVDAWCQQGPIHHNSLGIGNISREIEIFSEVMGFTCVRV